MQFLQRSETKIMGNRSKKLGKFGETYVEKYLERKQYSIIERNYRTPYGEIDLIAKDGTTLLFIEVKTRRYDSFGGLRESISKAKAKRIVLSAMEYLSVHPTTEDIRFDIAYLSVHGDTMKLEYHDSALPLDDLDIDVPFL